MTSSRRTAPPCERSSSTVAADSRGRSHQGVVPRGVRPIWADTSASPLWWNSRPKDRFPGLGVERHVHHGALGPHDPQRGGEGAGTAPALEHDVGAVRTGAVSPPRLEDQAGVVAVQRLEPQRFGPFPAPGVLLDQDDLLRAVHPGEERGEQPDETRRRSPPRGVRRRRHRGSSSSGPPHPRRRGGARWHRWSEVRHIDAQEGIEVGREPHHVLVEGSLTWPVACPRRSPPLRRPRTRRTGTPRPGPPPCTPAGSQGRASGVLRRRGTARLGSSVR